MNDVSSYAYSTQSALKRVFSLANLLAGDDHEPVSSEQAQSLGTDPFFVSADVSRHALFVVLDEKEDVPTNTVHLTTKRLGN